MAPDTPPSEWKLPKLRIDVDGEWFDDDVQITHPGILANLRGNLRKDAEGHFIQTRVRIPVEVADAPFVVTRVQRRGETPARSGSGRPTCRTARSRAGPSRPA